VNFAVLILIDNLQDRYIYADADIAVDMDPDIPISNVIFLLSQLSFISALYHKAMLIIYWQFDIRKLLFLILI
jgi:hypothetical protein